MTRLARLSGGMVNSVVLTTIDVPPGELVLKLSRTPGAFRGEARTLRWLREHTRLPVPAVLAVGDPEAGFGMLALERLVGVNLGEARARGGDFAELEHEMAEALAALHGLRRERFGAMEDGERFDRWVEAFRERYVGVSSEPQCRERLDAKTVDLVDRIAADLERAVDRPGPARLIHGDVWATNVMVRPDDRGTWHLAGFLDPGAHYADHEFELAYLLVFHTVGPTFFERYQDLVPIDEGFAERRLLYHLHTMLVHVWFFGDAHYVRAARDLARRVANWMGVDR